VTPAGRPVFRLRDVEKRHGKRSRFVLHVPELEIAGGEVVALTGPSGCGKSTLLELLALIAAPDRAGALEFAARDGGLDVAEAWRDGADSALARMRARYMGYVPQVGGLFGYLSARENIALPCRLNGLEARERVSWLAARLGIAAQLDRKPAGLSVGERQRVAIARAVAHGPAAVIADEPTAALDPIHAEETVALLVGEARAAGAALVLATHDHDLVDRLGCRRVGFDVEAAGGTGDGEGVVSTVRLH
jgi:putative ABC transport system ATP-binding protein